MGSQMPSNAPIKLVEPVIKAPPGNPDSGTNPSGPLLRGIAWRASIVFHAGLLGLLAVWYLPDRNPRPAVSDPDLKRQRQTLPDQVDRPVQQAQSQPSTEGLQTVKPEPPPELSAIKPPSAATVPDQQIKQSLEAQIQVTKARSDQASLKDLDQNLQRLERVVQPQSLDQIVASVGRSMGLDTQLYAEKTPPQGSKFDPDTAQLVRVERQASTDGDWSYQALMVDQNGNRETVPLTPTEGAAAYEAFEKIRDIPMAGALYQQLVMPLLQQMVAPEKHRPQGNIVVEPQPSQAPQADPLTVPATSAP